MWTLRGLVWAAFVNGRLRRSCVYGLVFTSCVSRGPAWDVLRGLDTEALEDICLDGPVCLEWFWWFSLTLAWLMTACVGRLLNVEWVQACLVDA